MSSWRNESGRPLASDAWLLAHHQAKLQERRAFAQRILERNPRRIVDLGCGTGLWLDLLAANAPAQCELIGLDTDDAALDIARKRAQTWPQFHRFDHLDLETQTDQLPLADVFLAFNVFPYVSQPKALLGKLKEKLNAGGCVVVRQYDGALLRMGPMDDEDRSLIDTSLKMSMLGSQQFKHYDLDRVFASIIESAYTNQMFDFEVFKRTAPYPADFRGYLANTIEWTRQYLSDDARERLDRWTEEKKVLSESSNSSYFVEVDMIAWLS